MGTANCRHLLLMDGLAFYINDRHILNLLGQYLRRTSERGGEFWDYEKGRSLGSGFQDPACDGG